jgi:hypothetical protein
MDHDDPRDSNDGLGDKEREASVKKMKSSNQPQSGASSMGVGNSGPASMQHMIAVTPVGNQRPSLPRRL